MVYEGLVDDAVAALGLVLRRRIVFVNGHYLHIPEGEFSLIVTAGKHPVKRCRSYSRSYSKAEQAVFLRLYCCNYRVCDFVSCRMGIREDVGPDFLVCVKYACGKVLFNETAFIGEGKMLD